MKVWTVNRPSKHPGENGRTFNVSLTCSEDWPESGYIPKRLVDVRERVVHEGAVDLNQALVFEAERLIDALRLAGNALDAGEDRKAKHIIRDALDPRRDG